MHRLVLVIGLLNGSFVAAGEPRPEPDDKNEAEKILGVWELLEVESAGIRLPGRATRMVMEFTRERLVVKTDGDVRGTVASYTIDPKPNPRAIDLNLDGNANKLFRGIYKIEKGKLTIVHDGPGGGRPRSFDERTAIRLIFRKSPPKK